MASKGKITARILSEEEGLVSYTKVHAVRVRSKKYVLLIMEDYMPTIGEIHGSVTLLTDDGEKIYPQVDGFFKHQGNEFTLVMR